MLAPWKKSYDKPRQHIKKHRHYFTNKYLYSQSYGFSSEIWTIKKSECWRIDASELWSWRGLLRVLWAARRSNQSILKEVWPEYTLEWLMLKLQYFGNLIGRTASFEQTMMLGKIEDRRRGRQRTRWLDSITDLMDMRLSKFWQLVMDRESSHAAVHGVPKSQTWLNNWAEPNWK